MRRSLTAAFVILLPATAGVYPKIDLPKDSPVAVLSTDYGDSTESARGGAMLVDLHAALSFRNLARVTVVTPENVGVTELLGAAAIVISEPALSALTARAGRTSRAGEEQS